MCVCAQEGRTACGRVLRTQRSRLVCSQHRHTTSPALGKRLCSQCHSITHPGRAGRVVDVGWGVVPRCVCGWKYRALPGCFWAPLLMGDGCDSGGRGWRAETRLVLRGIQGTRRSQADPCPSSHPLHATGERLHQQSAFVASLSSAVFLFLLSLFQSLQEFLTSPVSSHITNDQARAFLAVCQ